MKQNGVSSLQEAGAVFAVQCAVLRVVL